MSRGQSVAHNLKWCQTPIRMPVASGSRLRSRPTARPSRLVPIPAQHVVMLKLDRDLQDGGPMHAGFLYCAPAPFRFDPS